MFTQQNTENEHDTEYANLRLLSEKHYPLH